MTPQSRYIRVLSGLNSNALLPPSSPVQLAEHAPSLPSFHLFSPKSILLPECQAPLQPRHDNTLPRRMSPLSTARGIMRPDLHQPLLGIVSIQLFLLHMMPSNLPDIHPPKVSKSIHLPNRHLFSHLSFSLSHLPSTLASSSSSPFPASCLLSPSPAAATIPSLHSLSTAVVSVFPMRKAL